jgi:NAD(P)H-dependent FMN reductase
MVTIAVITGSVRPGRFTLQPSQWIYEILSKHPGVKAEFIDVAELNLPFFDEPGSPSMGTAYSKEHTRAWAKKVDSADGFIFVTPEYNHSYSPVLKNAVDYLYKEWNFKPATFVSYGALVAGSRAVEHLRPILAELKMYDLREQILIPSYWENLDKNGVYQFTDRQNKSAQTMIAELVFWAQIMKQARAEKSDNQK